MSLYAFPRPSSCTRNTSDMTSRSRSVSRSGTPPLYPRPAASRLLNIASNLRPSTSISSLHAHFEGTKSVAITSNEGIAMQDSKSTAKDGIIDNVVHCFLQELEEGEKSTLRSNLRRTLSGSPFTMSEIATMFMFQFSEAPESNNSERSKDLVDIQDHLPSIYPIIKQAPRKYYVLTDSGRPVYAR